MNRDSEPTPHFDEPAPPLPRELRGLTPRSVPPELWDAPSMVSSRRSGLIFLVIGFVVTVMGFLPIMQTWGLYFLPLAYLVWIGAAILILSIGYLLHFWATGGNLRYVEKADAAMAQIREIEIAESELNGVKTYSPQFSVVYQDAAMGHSAVPVRREQILSAPGITADKLAVSSLRFHPGDWVPVVWFPGKAETHATLYDTLGLNETGIWTTQDDPTPTPLWLTMLVVVCGGLLFFSLLWSIWAMGAYSPIETPPTGVIVLSASLGLVVAAVMSGLIYWQSQHERRRSEAAVARTAMARDASARGSTARSANEASTNEANANETSTTTIEDALHQPTSGWFVRLYSSLQGLILIVALAIGAVILPSLVVYELMVTANALLDDSEGEMEIAKIDEMIRVTHSGVFREYKIEYQLPARGPAGKDLSLMSNPEHMSRFEFDAAVAIVKPGALGWPWVSQIHPMERVIENKLPEQRAIDSDDEN